MSEGPICSFVLFIFIFLRLQVTATEHNMSSLKLVNSLLKYLDEYKPKPTEDDFIENDDEEMKVTGTEVAGKVDYEKLCVQFGCDLLTNDMIDKMENLTGKRVHPMIRRKLYYAHRDFDKILKCHQDCKPWYLYTGRGMLL